MSGKNSQQLLRELMEQARREGLSMADLSQMSQQFASPCDGDFEVLNSPLSSMTDASKRRLSPDSKETPDSSFKAAQMPLTSGKKEQDVENKFPEGIRSLEQWSKCVLEFGRFAKAGLTYGELANSTQEVHMSYVSWVLNRPNASKDPRYVDLVQFLKMSRKEKSHQDVVAYFPGSTLTRTFKD